MSASTSSGSGAGGPQEPRDRKPPQAGEQRHAPAGLRRPEVRRPATPAVPAAGPQSPPVLPRRPVTADTLPRRAPQAVALLAAVIAIALVVATDLAPGVVLIGTTVLAGIAIYAWSRAVEGRRRATDRAVTFSVTAAFLLAITPLVSVLWTVITRGTGRLDPEFFTESARNVVGAGGGASHAIIGTLIITGAATVISVPIGIMAAIYLQEYGTGALKRWLTFFVDVMTGIPSIVAGLFAFSLFQLLLGPGIRLGIMASIALSVLMIPIVVRATEEMLKVVPAGLREASLALGVPKWRTITKVVLPTALAGIVTGVMLAVARIMGETAPLLITAGVVDSINTNPFDGRMQNLPVYAFNQYKNPGAIAEPYIDRAWTAALTLILIVMLLNIAARFIYRRFGTEIR